MKGWLKALLFFLAWILTQAIIMTPIALIFGMNGEGFGEVTGQSRTLLLLLTSLLQLGATGLVIYIFLKFIEKVPFSSLGFSIKGKSKHLLFGMLLGAGLISIGILSLTAFGLVKLDLGPLNIFAITTSIVLFAIVAVNEEVMARGYLLRVLMESSGKYWALAISAIIFALLHGMNPNLSWIAMLNLFLAGCLLGLYYIHYKNLWFSIGLHFTWNYFQGPIWGSNVSGTTSESLFSQQLSGNEMITGGAFGFEASLVCTVFMMVALVAVELWARKANTTISA